MSSAATSRIERDLAGEAASRSSTPFPGGTDNPYVYVLNPTDQFDLNGMWWHWARKHWEGIATGAVFGACLFLSAGGCAVASVGLAYAVIQTLAEDDPAQIGARSHWIRPQRSSVVVLGVGQVAHGDPVLLLATDTIQLRSGRSAADQWAGTPPLTTRSGPMLCRPTRSLTTTLNDGGGSYSC